MMRLLHKQMSLKLIVHNESISNQNSPELSTKSLECKLPVTIPKLLQAAPFFQNKTNQCSQIQNTACQHIFFHAYIVLLLFSFQKTLPTTAAQFENLLERKESIKHFFFCSILSLSRLTWF